MLARKLPAVVRNEAENERLIAELEEFDNRDEDLTPEELEYLGTSEDANYGLEGSIDSGQPLGSGLDGTLLRELFLK